MLVGVLGVSPTEVPARLGCAELDSEYEVCEREGERRGGW